MCLETTTMPVPGNKCCILGCRATSHNYDGTKIEDGVRFFAIPKVKKMQSTTEQTKDITRRRRLAWIAAVGRPDIVFEKHTNGRVCSRHFHKGKVLLSAISGFSLLEGYTYQVTAKALPK